MYVHTDLLQALAFQHYFPPPSNPHVLTDTNAIFTGMKAAVRNVPKALAIHMYNPGIRIFALPFQIAKYPKKKISPYGSVQSMAW